VEVRHERIRALELEPRRDEEVGTTRQGRAARDRLEYPDRRRPDRRHVRSRLDPYPRILPHLVALAVQPVLGERLGRHRPERVEADVQRYPLDVQRSEELGREMEARGRRRRRAALVGVNGLVALGILERLGDVRRQGGLPMWLAAQPKPPPTLAERLEELDGPERHARPQAAARPRERLPDVFSDPLQKKHLGPAAGRPVEHEPRGQHPRVVHDDEGLRDKLGPQIPERSVLDHPSRAVENEQPRLVPALERTLGDELWGELVIKLRRPHADIRNEG
jgi:hypothetical protein